MWSTYNTANVKGLEEFRFTVTKVLTYGSGIVSTHAWHHIPTADDAGGFGSKAEAVKSARRYRDVLREEAKR